MSNKKNYHKSDRWKKKGLCSMCGKNLEIILIDKVGALDMETIRCGDGHTFVRFRLSEIGE